MKLSIELFGLSWNSDFTFMTGENLAFTLLGAW